jgi:LPXTG-motif cell wall-anchored protein
VATPAFGVELPPPGGDPVHGLTIVKAPSGLSFTGANVTMWMVLSVGMLLIGLALLIAGRRRRASAAP